MFGAFATDVTHIITVWFVDVLPGGYWFPLVGSLIKGLCGSECFTQPLICKLSCSNVIFTFAHRYVDCIGNE